MPGGMTLEQQFKSAVSHHQAGRLAEAERFYRQVLAQQPDHADALHLLGMLAAQAGRLDAGVEFMRRSIRVRPDFVNAHYNLAIALQDKGQFDEAIASYRRAIQLQPDYAEAHNNLGIALTRMEQLEEPIGCFRRAIRLKPGYAEAHYNLGNALRGKGQLDETIASYRQAIRLRPDFAEAHHNLLYTLHYHPGYDARTIYEEARRWNRQYGEPLRRFIRPHANNRDPDRRLRIGYVSADFRLHSVSWFLLPLFRHHDHGAYEIIGYCDVANGDGMTDSLRACADGWQNIVGRSDEQVADKVREDGIDVLIDLAGHTAGNRLLVFARRPAPVQISYLGYPGTTGLSQIDYRLSDFLADPPGQTELLHSEKLWRLPVCNWCYGKPDGAPPVRPLPAGAGGPICFGTFNNFAKASPAIMDLWAAILIAMRSSRLIIKSRGLAEESVRRQIKQDFASRGVQAERLEVRGFQPDVISHLEVYNQVDIALDTFPYHGTTTTCEALWMGVPVVTLAGPAHVSRVGVSLLSNIGLPELIAQKPQQYVQIATDLANDLPRLAELRRTLRARMQASALMDAPRFARNVEATYRQMWRNWCQQRGNSSLQCPAR
ncbi:MAG: tetratricopeptide repeat protein [Tepidisphaeraceae bacterium]|jgi:predicted O-linked N-acetylglucosamine transferase (SPINDLY family)